MAAVGKRSRRGSAWLGAVLTVHEVLAAGCMRGLRGARPVPYARHPRRRPRMTRAVGSVGQSTAPPGGDGRNGDCLTVHGVIAAVRKRSRGGSAWLGGFLTVHEVLAAGRACGPPASDHRHADPRIESMGRLRRHPRLASAPAVEAGEAGWSPGVIRGGGVSRFSRCMRSWRRRGGVAHRPRIIVMPTQVGIHALPPVQPLQPGRSCSGAARSRCMRCFLGKRMRRAGEADRGWEGRVGAMPAVHGPFDSLQPEPRQGESRG